MTNKTSLQKEAWESGLLKCLVYSHYDHARDCGGENTTVALLCIRWARDGNRIVQERGVWGN